MKILIVEDHSGFAYLIKQYLKLNFNPEELFVTHAESLKEGLEQLKGHDVVLLDLGLPDSQGIDTLKSFIDYDPFTPVVVLTGLDDDNIAREALQKGAQDYLIKEEVGRRSLYKSIHYAYERKKAELKLYESEKRFKKLFEAIPDAAYVIDKEGEIKEVNSAFCQKTGYDREELTGTNIFVCHFISEESRKKLYRNMGKRMEGEKPLPYIIEVFNKNGEIITAQVNNSLLMEGDKVVGMVGIAREYNIESEEVLYDFLANLKLVTQEKEELEERPDNYQKVRTILSKKHLLLATQDNKHAVGLGRIFDIRKIPLADSKEEAIKLGFLKNNYSNIATLRGDKEKMDRFSYLLMKYSLKGSRVIYKHPAIKNRIILDKEWKEGILDVDKGAILLDDCQIKLNSITNIRAEYRYIGSNKANILIFDIVDSGKPIESFIYVPDSRIMNLFGRYIEFFKPDRRDFVEATN